MIIGDAHDQPALALHQVLHHWCAPLISDVITRAGRRERRSYELLRVIQWMARITEPAPCRWMHDSTLAVQSHASIRLNTSVALVPPKPKEFDSTVPSLALSMRLRTIGMSANTGSSSVMLALSQTKPLFIISSE